MSQMHCFRGARQQKIAVHMHDLPAYLNGAIARAAGDAVVLKLHAQHACQIGEQRDRARL